MSVIFIAVDSSNVEAQPPLETKPARALPLQPRQPGGLLNEHLGAYLTIEGVLYDGKGKVESNTLVVDTVNGKNLVKPILILVQHVRLPAKVRCVLKEYELGTMIGSPPAYRQAAADLGKQYVEQSATGWRWRPYFVPLIAVQPQDLELPKIRGVTD